ncbi:MAG: FecR domain-containing protein [Verrucomicrobia bacterium]|nr:FecR domain-containing protein [Verrucomicrobiota bacterium]
MDQDRLPLLLQRYFDQMLSADERLELEQMLLASARAREAFWETARWHALLRQWGEAEWGRMSADFRDLQTSTPSRWRGLAGISRRRWTYAALVTALLALGGQQFLNHRDAPVSAPMTQARNGIALLASTADAVWINPTESRQAGQTLPPGWLRLASGAVQIEFARGARVVLEGPAEFQLISESNAELRSGRMRAHVPEPAKGFTITTPGMVLVDRGTEFACSIPVLGAPEVHVFRGEVDVNLARSGGAFQSLRENQSVRIHDGHAFAIQSNPGAFLSEQALARRTAENIRIRVAMWRKASGKFSQHTNALVHLDFEPEGTWQRFLDNRVTNAPQRSAASVIGCDWEYGRWPGKLALEFKRTDDRLRFSVSGGHDALTLIAWVRVDSLAHKQHALLMSDNIQRGAIHWYLQHDGRLGLGIHAADESAPNGWLHVVSPPAVRPELLGAWVMLATVVDGTAGTVTHYCDGQLVGSTPASFPKPLRPGTCELGNWTINPAEPKWSWFNPQAGDDYMRSFHGRMDEFTLLATALDAGEINRLYEAGRPGDSTTVLSFLPLAKAL